MTECTLSILDNVDLSRRRFLMAVASGVSGICYGLLSPPTARSHTTIQTLTLGRVLMGTVVESEANHPDLSIAREAVSASLKQMAEVDRLMSIFLPHSEISRVNRFAATLPTQVGPQTFSVLQEAENIARLSRGAFDVTIHPLMQLWRSASKNGRLPSQQEIDSALGLVACGDLSLDAEHRRVRFRQPGMGIDLGGIAKGYAVDVAAEAFASRGVNSGLINAGGDLRVVGRNREGNSWRVGLRHPLTPSRLLLSILVEDEAVATSGNYFRSFTVAGRRYGHLLRPRNGTAADVPLSATVVAKTAMRADGLATAAMIHEGEALDFMHRLAGVEGIVVNRLAGHPGKVSVQVTPGLEGRVELLDHWSVFER